MLRTLNKMQAFALGGYVVALLTTMSGMEIFSSLLVVLLIVRWAIERDKMPIPPFALPMALFVGMLAVLSSLLQ